MGKDETRPVKNFFEFFTELSANMMSLSAVDNSSQCIHSLSIQQEIKFNEI